MAGFLVDESLPRAVTHAFLAAGHDVIDARDAGLRGAADDTVFRSAAAQQRILLSGDLDFANALRFPPGTHAGIVVLRVPEGWLSIQRAERMLSGVEEAGLERILGAIVIVEPSRTRIFAPPPDP